MKKFRKKPVVIDAVQFVAESIDFNGVLEFCTKARVKKAVLSDDIYLEIPTLEGNMLASDGDWIIKGVNGEFYLCKPDIFEKTYERIEL